MSTVALIDSGVCNLDSARRALEECGARPLVTEQASDLATADRIVLPGVGAFPAAMKSLRSKGLDTALCEAVEDGVPLLAVCLGMQLLAKQGTEGAPCDGLAIIDADVIRLEPSESERVPHVGWNEVVRVRQHPVLEGLPPTPDFYFVHAYHVRCFDPNDVVATTPYCGGFTSVVARDNVVGVQFHPEKSQGYGRTLLRNFLAWQC